MSWQDTFLDSLAQCILSAGGSLPVFGTPTNFEEQSLGLLKTLGSVIGRRSLIQPPWVNLAFQNSWSNFGGAGYATGQYRKYSGGLVEIKGLLKRGAGTPVTPEPICTPLPISCRPSDTRLFSSSTYNGVMNVSGIFFLVSNGEVSYANGGTSYFSIECVFSGTPTAIFFGDSITIGQGVANANNRWSLLVANTLGLVEDNQGIGATVLQNSAPAAVNNGRDRYYAAIVLRFPTQVFILYGLNDIRFNGASFTAAAYQAQLGEVAAGIIASGVPAGNITIGSPPYVNPAFYASGSPFDAGSVTKHLIYREAARAVAKAYGCKFADVYQTMLVSGGNSLMSADGIHPNDAGHQVIANAMLNALVP